MATEKQKAALAKARAARRVNSKAVGKGNEGAEMMEKPKGEQPIIRRSKVAWWCPVCDSSMESRLEKCAKCGAVRHGDMVTA